jgi:hypothetical protein
MTKLAVDRRRRIRDEGDTTARIESPCGCDECERSDLDEVVDGLAATAMALHKVHDEREMPSNEMFLIRFDGAIRRCRHGAMMIQYNRKGK